MSRATFLFVMTFILYDLRSGTSLQKIKSALFKCREYSHFILKEHITFLLVIKFFSIVTDISVTGMAVAKKNLSQIDKLVAFAAVSYKLDHTSQK